jgi:rSAM/selenodomain-associated transferase 1
MTPTRIVIFAKAPVPGKAKTRLIPALGAEGAARLAANMLTHTVTQAISAGVGEPELCATPSPDTPEWAGVRPPGIRMIDQGHGDLGERLSRAAARVIGASERILLIGSDCPELDSNLLRLASQVLGDYDAVMHPAQDGGYALLGLRRFDLSLFEDIPWSTNSVAADTQARIHRLGWSLHLGATLRDVDEPEDLHELSSWLPAG